MKYIFIALVGVCLIFGYLSYSFYGSKIKAEGDLRVAQASLLSLQSSLSKKEQECKIADSISSKWQKEKQEADRQKESSLERIDKIDRIPTKSSTKPPVTRSEASKNEAIDIDSPLPSELSRVLSDAYSASKGSSSDNPR